MLWIPVIIYPSYEDLGCSVEERLSGSIDHSKVKTAESQLNNFFRYLDKYNLRNEYLLNDTAVTDPLIARYIDFCFKI